MEEVVEEASQEEVLADLRDLVKSRGWARLSSIAKAQIATRNTNVLKPLKGDGIYEQEFQKGEIAGIQLFMQLPDISIESLRQQLEEESANETQDDAPAE